jgi:hypothetical protein
LDIDRMGDSFEGCNLGDSKRIEAGNGVVWPVLAHAGLIVAFHLRL